MSADAVKVVQTWPPLGHEAWDYPVAGPDPLTPLFRADWEEVLAIAQRRREALADKPSKAAKPTAPRRGGVLL